MQFVGINGGSEVKSREGLIWQVAILLGQYELLEFTSKPCTEEFQNYLTRNHGTPLFFPK